MTSQDTFSINSISSCKSTLMSLGQLEVAKNVPTHHLCKVFIHS